MVATVDTVPGVFRKDPLAYAGRPPIIDFSARSELGSSLRVVIIPQPLSQIANGTYECSVGHSYVSLTNYVTSSQAYDTYSKPGGKCTITITEAGSAPGDRFSGTFSATLQATAGVGQMAITGGQFLGILSN